MCLQSHQTPDLGTPASQLTAVGHTRDRAATEPAATEPAAAIPHHFLDAENTFLNREEDPSHSSWASCSEPPAPMHITNATADLSTCNGIPATLGQHNDCPDRDDTERTRPVTTPSVPPPHDVRPPFVPLDTRTPPMTHRLHASVTMWLFSGIHLRFSHNGRYHGSLWILSNISALNSSSWPRKPAYLAMIRRSQPPLLQTTPESKTTSAVMYATLIMISGSKNAKIQPSEAT